MCPDKLPAVYMPDADAPPYEPMPMSPVCVRCDFRVDFTDGGHIDGVDFQLDCQNEGLTSERLAEMLVSALNLRDVGTVSIRRMEIVPRGLLVPEETV